MKNQNGERFSTWLMMFGKKKTSGTFCSTTANLYVLVFYTRNGTKKHKWPLNPRWRHKQCI
jgi:hypothetical protein